jgi:hypothetical protein
MKKAIACVGKNSDGWYCLEEKYSDKYLTKDKTFKGYDAIRNSDYYFELKDILNILKELGRNSECLYSSYKEEYNKIMTELAVFKKSDLKNGDIVINRGDEVYIVLDDYIRGPDGFDELSNYKEDLKSNSSYGNLDIMKVYRPGNTLRGLVLEPFDPGGAKLVYRREDNPNITIDRFKVSFHSNHIVVGCKHISKEEIKAIYIGSLKNIDPAPKLQGGDVIVTKGENAYQLCGDKFVGKYGWNESGLYDDDLMNTKGMSGYDVMEVYRARLKQGEFRLHPFNQGSMEKIWSRNTELKLESISVLFLNDYISVDGHRVTKDVVKQIYEVYWGQSE